MPLWLFPGESQLLRFGGRGGRETGKWPVTLWRLPPPPYGDRRAQCDPARGQPRAGHSVAFVPRPGSHLGLSPCNWCQGKREMGVQGCWPGWGGAQPPPELRGWAGRAPCRPSSCAPCPGESEKSPAYLLPLPPGHTPASPERPAGAGGGDGTGGRRSRARRKRALARRPLRTQEQGLESRDLGTRHRPDPSLATGTRRLTEGNGLAQNLPVSPR